MLKAHSLKAQNRWTIGIELMFKREAYAFVITSFRFPKMFLFSRFVSKIQAREFIFLRKLCKLNISFITKFTTGLKIKVSSLIRYFKICCAILFTTY